jgi:hypothetical protein
VKSIPSEKSAVRTLERLKNCLYCSCDMHPPNLVLKGHGYFYVICEMCDLENRVWVVDDEKPKDFITFWDGDVNGS